MSFGADEDACVARVQAVAEPTGQRIDEEAVILVKLDQV